MCGLLLAKWSFAFLQRLIPDSLALSTTLNLDLQVLGFTLLLALATAVVFGLVPAFQASKIDLNDALKQGGGRSGLNVGGNRLRSTMVVIEVALALVLLVGSGLLIQISQVRVSIGLRPKCLDLAGGTPAQPVS